MREIHDFKGMVELIGRSDGTSFAEGLMEMELAVPFDPSNPHCFKRSFGSPLMVCENGEDLDFVVKLVLKVDDTNEKLLELFADDRKSVFLVDLSRHEEGLVTIYHISRELANTYIAKYQHVLVNAIRQSGRTIQ